MLEDIQKLIEDLSWDNPKDVVDKAINQLLKIDDEQVTLLLQPVNKSCWENAAKVLQMIGYPRNKLALPGLIEWLRDMNWPGAQISNYLSLKNYCYRTYNFNDQGSLGQDSPNRKYRDIGGYLK